MIFLLFFMWVFYVLLIMRMYIHSYTGKNSFLYSSSKLSWRCRTANITFMFTSVADLSKFKGGRLGFRRCYAKSYEVRAFLFSSSSLIPAYISRLRVVKSRTQVTSARNNRIFKSRLAVISLTVIAKSARIIVAVNCTRTWAGDNHLEVG